MKKKHFRFLSLAFFLVGIFFLLNSKTDISGAVVGASNISSGISSIFGIVFILASVVLFVGVESLEGRVKSAEKSLKRKLEKIVRDKLPNDFVIELLESKNPLSKGVEKYFQNHPEFEYNQHNSIDYLLEQHKTPTRIKAREEGEKSIHIKDKGFKGIITFNGYKNNLFKRITNQTQKMTDVWRAANRKLYNLSESGHLGKMNVTYKYVPDSDNKYLYLRSRGDGARVFLKRLNSNEYELVAVCYGGQTKRDEKMIIEKIQEIYKKEKKKK